MACLEFKMLTEIIEGTLSPKEKSLVDAHLKTCVNCRVLLAEAMSNSRPSLDESGEIQNAPLDAGDMDATHVGPMGVAEPPLARPSRTPAEKKMISIVIASEVSEMDSLRSEIEAREGRLFPGGSGFVYGVFGLAEHTSNDSMRAVDAALAARYSAHGIAVVTGFAYFGSAGVGGGVVDAGLELAVRESLGVAIDEATAEDVSERFWLRESFDGVMEAIATRQRDLGDTGFVALGEMVGRDRELAELILVVESAFRQRRSHVIVLSGPEGIGKTRLRRALQRHLTEKHPSAIQLVGRANSFRHDEPFSLIADVLWARLRQLVRERRASAEDLLGNRRQAVISLAEEAISNIDDAISVSVALGYALDVDVSDDVPESPTTSMGERIAVALQAYFQGLCARGPFFVAFEDADAADDASIDCIEAFIAEAKDEPCVVLLTTSDEAWRRDFGEAHGGVTQLVVPPLSPDASRELLMRSAQGPRVARHMDAITQKAAGNPLAIETLMTLAARAETELPTELDVALKSWIDGLPEDARNVVNAISVFFGACSRDALRGMKLARVEAVLDDLEDDGILDPSATDSDRVRLKHERLRHLVYAALPGEVRADLHRRVALALETEGAPAALVAKHFSETNSKIEARDAWFRAFQTALSRDDIEGFLRAFDALDVPNLEDKAQRDELLEIYQHFLERFGVATQ